MRLTSIQMSGFKSFVEPTRVIFDLPLTGVVGPNGCGKSNIIDAIRWVLGESARNIRGETLDDIIFDGSDSRKRLDQASIEVVIDNSLGRIGGEYANFSEIRIRREVSREAEHQSRYYINGTHVRRKDVSDLFQGTGLGRGNYAIIAQGMVQGLIEAKPDGMRKYIEEAAGISLYRERRRDTENRIRRTEENLGRLQDILQEHEQRLRHLKQQKGQASKLESLQKEHRARENEWVSLQLQEQRKILEDREKEYAGVEKKRVQEENKLKTLNENFEKKRSECDLNRRSMDEAVALHQQLLADAGSIDQRIRLQRERKDQAVQEIERLDVEIGELEESGEKVREDLQRLEQQHDQNRQELARIQAEQEKTETLRTEQVEALRQCQGKIDTIREQTGSIREERTREQTQLQQYRNELQHLRETGGAVEASGDPRTALKEKCDAARLSWQQCKEQLEQNWDQIQQARLDLKRHAEALSAAQEQKTQAQGRLASLEALQQAGLTSDSEAHAKALQEMRLQGERLMNHIEVEGGWEFAVETVLAENLEAFCVEGLPETVDETRVPGTSPLMLLDRRSSGAREPDRMSLASRVKSPFSLESQLGGVLAAETLEQAYAVRDSLLPHQSIITQSGVWLGPDWMRLPAAEGQAEGALERRREIEVLGEKLKQLESESEEIGQHKQAAEQELRQQEESRAALQAEYDRAFEEFAASKAQLQGLENQAQRLEKLQQNIRQSQNRLQRCEQQIKDLDQDSVRADAAHADAQEVLRKSDKEVRRQSEELNRFQLEVNTAQMKTETQQQQLSREQNTLQRHRIRRDQLSQGLAAVQEDEDLEQRLKEKREKEQEAEEHLRRERAASDQLNSELSELDRKRWESNQRFTELGKDLHDKDLRRQEIQNACEQLLSQLREQECEPEQILQTLPEDADVDQWEEKVFRVMRRLERMPPVNMAAAREYDELLEQKNKEEERMNDIQAALEKLNHAMEKIDRETRERFRRTFSQVNENLKQMFPRIIGEGGEANLVMTEQNLLSTGIEVRARPPGKRYRNMHMLSGGEQAMVAVSLVLSLFMLNPAPFCILDEVDAPLSDDNLLRFCQILNEMSEQVQFIIVTHNKITMEHVDQLVGVTMNEPGVSRLVTVNVAQAMEMVEQAEVGHA